MAAVADVPLTGGDDLQRLVALLVEVRLALGRLGITDELAVLPQHRHGLLARREGRLAGDPLVRRRVDHPVGGLTGQSAVAADDRPGGQVELPPPGDVGEVTERTAHRDTRPLVGLGVAVGQHRHLDPEDRRRHRAAEQRLVALVVGVGDQGAAGGQQLGPGRLDHDLAAVGAVEVQRVVEAGVVAGLELRLGDRGLESDVPHRRRLGHVRLAAPEVVQEGPLGDGLRLVGDRRVEQAPVDRQADVLPEVLEDLLVQGGQPVAQLDEVAAADRHLALGVRLGRRGEVRVVRDRRVAPYAVVVLHPPLGRQAVVVPADRVEHLLAAHPLVAGDDVGVRVGEHVADMQGAGDRGRRGVDGEHRGARHGPVEGVRPALVPAAAPGVLEPFQSGLLRYSGLAYRGDRAGRCRGGRGVPEGFAHGVHLTDRPRPHAHHRWGRDRSRPGTRAVPGGAPGESGVSPGQALPVGLTEPGRLA
ncbi:hypothetical protein SDC9_80114 [bioreactor metagenome]|uniref:Uncharacterized protein n=1 Tax=bioreactor metagenome TaxID=1076179 RepID=A0A644YZR9_9ZZZZ